MRTVALVALFLLALARVAPSQVFKTFHAFKGLAGGLTPVGNLAEGADGALYGTTSEGGANNQGVVYRITPGGAYAVLYSLGAGAGGGKPEKPLVHASDGALYGVTSSGGTGSSGTFFRITTAGTFTKLRDILYTKDLHWANGLMQASGGFLYGSSMLGGANGNGCVFRMTLAGEVTVIYDFPQNASRTWRCRTLPQASSRSRPWPR